MWTFQRFGEHLLLYSSQRCPIKKAVSRIEKAFGCSNFRTRSDKRRISGFPRGSPVTSSSPVLLFPEILHPIFENVEQCAQGDYRDPSFQIEFGALPCLLFTGPVPIFCPQDHNWAKHSCVFVVLNRLILGS